ncbi:acyl-CoA dehydrogenase family protein [Actinophytocola glycyrrhizae]|uniref:Acyl-CoA dehydrogenase family protein n=1 Tax=Actinophytocola glycyrrhizae TaxID=2044873 RepID=A0ABV9S591_9PSEU
MTTDRALVAGYGSPLYRYDLAEVAAAVADLRAALPSGALLYYSLKANANPDVLVEVRRHGLRAEVSSTGELTAALRAGFDPGRCLYTGPGKTTDEIAAALAAGVGLFSTESLGDLARIAATAREAGVEPDCLLRINVSDVAGGAGVRMSGGPSQFGFDAGRVEKWVAGAVATPGVTVSGLHFFSVSNARDEEVLLGELRTSLATAARLRAEHGVPLQLLDLGGGFAAPYATPGERSRYAALRDALTGALDEHLPGYTGEVAFESGRYVVACAGRLVTTVTDVKENHGTRYAVLDSGVNHIGGMSALRRMLPLTARPLTEHTDRPMETVTLVGPLCAPSDVLAHDVTLPALAPGDLVVVPNVGAYGLSASLLGFLGRDLPAEVAVRGDAVVGASRQALVRRPLPRLRTPRELAEEILPVVRDAARAADEAAELPAASMAALRGSGLMGLLVPTEFGGLGGDLTDLVAVCQVLGGACTSTALVFAMHCQQVDAVVRFGTPSLRAGLLPRVAAGGMYLASITSEREKGGHLLTSAAPLDWHGDTATFVRDAPIVTGATHADGFLVTMRARPDADPREVTLVFVDRREAEVETKGEWNPLGMRGTHSLPLRLTATVPSADVVGAPGAFREVAVESFMPLAHIGWAAVWLGTARQALHELVSRLRSPKRPSSVDLSSDLVAERVARIRHDLELVSAYLGSVVAEVTDHRARGASLGAPHVQIHLNTLKVTAAELTYAAVDRCVQLGGLGLGYLRNSPVPLERYFRDLRAAALNYSNERLLKANGVLALADRGARLV